MKFRKATRSDLDRLTEIHLAAYPDERSVEARERNFTQNSFGPYGDLVVVEDAGTVVGHAFLFRFQAAFGGTWVKVGGVASVGVAPEARGRGVATALMQHLHVRSDRRGDAITLLYAFRQGFYARLGYAATSSRKRLSFTPRSVPSAWTALARERVRALRGEEHKALRVLHERAAERATGWIQRPRAYWDRVLANDRRYVLVCDVGSKKASSLAGYVSFRLVQDEVHGPTRLDVDDLVALDDASRRALFGALGAMRDQVSEIAIELPDGDPLERALVDADAHAFGTADVEHRLGEIVGGPMVRIEDIPRALAARGYRADGAFDVVVREPGAEDTTIAASLRVRGRRAEVGPARGGGALETTRAGLAAMFYGTLSVPDAVALGLADADRVLAERVDAVIRLPPFSALDAF